MRPIVLMNERFGDFGTSYFYIVSIIVRTLESTLIRIDIYEYD